MDKEKSIKALLEHLQLTEGTAFAYEEEALVRENQKRSSEQSSLAVKVLTVFGGFLATLAFVGFLFITGLTESEVGLTVFGIGFIAGAIWLNQVYDRLLIDTSGIAIFVIGFAMLGFGLEGLGGSENVVYGCFIVLAAATLALTQSYMLSFISVLVLNGSFLALIIENDGYNIIHGYVAVLTLALTYWILKEAKIITAGSKLSRLYNPVRIGLVCSFLMGLVFVGKRGLVPMAEDYRWVSSIVTIAMVLYLISYLMPIFGVMLQKAKITVYAISFLLLLTTAFSPAISGGILLVLLSFLVNYKTGFIIGVVALLYFVGQYYYDLRFTLLVKSGILFLAGLLFLLFYFLTNRTFSTNEKA